MFWNFTVVLKCMFFCSGVYYDPFLAAQAATATPLQVNPVSNAIISCFRVILS